MTEQHTPSDEQDGHNFHVSMQLGVIINIINIVDGQPRITPVNCDDDDAVEIIRAVAKGLERVDGMTRQ